MLPIYWSRHMQNQNVYFKVVPSFLRKKGFCLIKWPSKVLKNSFGEYCEVAQKHSKWKVLFWNFVKYIANFGVFYQVISSRTKLLFFWRVPYFLEENMKWRLQNMMHFCTFFVYIFLSNTLITCREKMSSLFWHSQNILCHTLQK